MKNVSRKVAAPGTSVSYLGRHAELYDLFYADKPYAEEAAFVHRCLLRHADGQIREVLELACGTGNHAMALEKHGYRIVATDNSQDMLDQAERKRDRLGSSVTFRLQDMCRLEAPDRPFDAVVCLFDSLGYLTSIDQLRDALAGVRRSLRPGGLFAFEVLHTGAMLRHYEPVRVRRLALGGAEVLRLSETKMNYAAATMEVSYDILELRDDGNYRRLLETQRNRFYTVAELAAELKLAGLTPVRWFNGYHDAESIDGETWHIVGIARRSE